MVLIVGTAARHWPTRVQLGAGWSYTSAGA